MVKVLLEVFVKIYSVKKIFIRKPFFDEPFCEVFDFVLL